MKVPFTETGIHGATLRCRTSAHLRFFGSQGLQIKTKSRAFLEVTSQTQTSSSWMEVTRVQTIGFAVSGLKSNKSNHLNSDTNYRAKAAERARLNLDVLRWPTIPSVQHLGNKQPENQISPGNHSDPNHWIYCKWPENQKKTSASPGGHSGTSNSTQVARKAK